MTPVNLAEQRLLRSALYYAEHYGWAVIPLHSPRLDGSCSCSRPHCNNIGKHPRTKKGLKDASKDPAQIRLWWSQWPDANIGVVTGRISGLVVLDIDPRHDGDDALVDLEREHGKLPDTPVCLTGGAGQHYYLAYPAGKKRVKCRVVAHGVELKGDGGYVVATPSLHASGKQYTWEALFRPDTVTPAVAPDWLIATEPESHHSAAPTSPGHPVDTSLLGRAFAAAGMLGRDMGGDRRTVSCPWRDEHTVGEDHDGATVLFAPRGGSAVGWFHCSHAHCTDRSLADVLAALPADAVAEAQQSMPDLPCEDNWASRLLRKPPDANGHQALQRDGANAVTILAHDPRWRGVIAFDIFARRIRVVGSPPWHADFAPGGETDDPFWSDEHTHRVRYWLSREWRLALGFDEVHAAITVCANRNRVHPVRDYLRSLLWDGVKRLDTWCCRVFGSPDTASVRLFCVWWLIGAIARVDQPGCKLDNVVILEGQEGVGKGRALRVLYGEEHFTDVMPTLVGKDAYQQLPGIWCVELGELTSLLRTDPAAANNFFTMTVDRYRKSYGRETGDVPRQCHFVGTTNDDSYLRERCGARRYCPIKVNQIDLNWLKANRDQLWAEAYHRYQAGEAWYPAGRCEVASDEQELRFIADAWEGRVATWLRTTEAEALLRTNRVITIADVLSKALVIEMARWDHRVTVRIGKIFSRLGWSQVRIRVGVERVRGYQPGEGWNSV